MSVSLQPPFVGVEDGFGHAADGRCEREDANKSKEVAQQMLADLQMTILTTRCQITWKSVVASERVCSERISVWSTSTPRTPGGDSAPADQAKGNGFCEDVIDGSGQKLRHRVFAHHFCLVRRANEKGHVESLLGFARRNFLVPIPQVESLEALNQELLARCQEDLDRRLRGNPA